MPDPPTVNRSRLRSTVIPRGQVLSTCARRMHWPALFNASGRGDARFSPVRAGGRPVPTAYLARTDTVAMLETALHEVAPTGAKVVDPAIDLAPWMLVRVRAPTDIRLVDLRDGALARIGLGRTQLISTSAGHYSCTREWAAALRGQVIGGQPTHGLMWNSRVAEIGGAASAVLGDVGSEACVLFGGSVTTRGAAWEAVVRHEDLAAGAGLIHVEEIVTLLGATII